MAAGKQYRVISHQGETIDLKTKTTSGTLWLDAEGVRIEGGNASRFVPFASLQRAELLRLHGLGSMIRMSSPEGSVFVSVVRFAIGDYFAVVNFLKTRELHAALQEGMHRANPEGTPRA